MTQRQLILASMTWNKTQKNLLAQDPNLDRKDLENERQEILKLAGAKPDENGRYSMKTLSNSALSNFLDLCETTLGGQPNQKRRSRSLIWCIERLTIPGVSDREAYLNAISADKFHTQNWRDLDVKSLKFLLWTAKNRAVARAK